MANNEQLLAFTKFQMIFGGFWIKPVTSYSIINKLYIFYSIFVKLGLLAFCITLLMEFIRVAVNKEASQVVISSFGIMLSFYLFGLKIFISERNNLLYIFDEIIEKEKEIWESDDGEIKEMYTRHVYFCNILCFVQFLILEICTTALGYNAIKADEQLIEYNRANNASLESHNWYQFWFPGSKLNHRSIVYTINIITATIGGMADVGWHSVFSALMIFAATRLQTLQIKLRKFLKDDTMENFDIKTAELKQAVVEHQYLIRYVENLNNSIKYVVFMHYSLNAIEISSTIMGLLQSSIAISQQVFHVFYIMLTLYQVYMTSWNANEIREQSAGIANALYQSDWLLLNKEGKMILQLMMHRAQRPLTITIGPFGPITNQSIVTIIKTAYSYVSIMHK